MPLKPQAGRPNGPPIEPVTTAMADTIERWTLGKTDCATLIPSLTFFRREAPARPVMCLVEPSIVVVVQGSKRMLVGGEAYPYDVSRFLLTTLDLPANSEVVDASPGQPCVGLVFKLDLRTVAELLAQGGLPFPREAPNDLGLGLGAVTESLLNPLKRLIDLLDEPHAIPVLAPLIEREIHYRLLLSDQAARMCHIAAIGSQGHRVTKAIDWLKTHYAATLKLDELAAYVQMSTSSLHQHFRQLTAMSPLQYQKWLRLSEARRLMLNEDKDAASASFAVGYESPSQFSREYTRLFGVPPKRDIKALREQATRPLMLG